MYEKKEISSLLCICLLFVGLSLPVPVLAEKAEVWKSQGEGGYQA